MNGNKCYLQISRSENSQWRGLQQTWRSSGDRTGMLMPEYGQSRPGGNKDNLSTLSDEASSCNCESIKVSTDIFCLAEDFYTYL